MNNNAESGWLKKVIAIAVAATAATSLTLTDQKQHIEALLPAFEEYEIDTCDRVAAALAQFAHETGGYRWLRELGSDKYLRRYGGYPGAGYIHLTWKYNYKEMQDCTGIPIVNNPKLAYNPEVAAKISACWWKEHGLNEYADNRDMRRLTKIINGRYTGMESRMNYYREITKAFGKSGICNKQVDNK